MDMIPLSGFSWGSASNNMATLASGGKAYTITSDTETGFWYGDDRGITLADPNGDGINDIILSCPYCTTLSPYNPRCQSFMPLMQHPVR
jgi:hypothetical protein